MIRLALPSARRAQRCAAALLASVAALTLSMSSPAGASSGGIESPTVRKVDQDGDRLVGMQWDGQACSRRDLAEEWICDPLHEYAWTDMTSISDTGDSINQDIQIYQSRATTCDEARQTMSFFETKAPKGYDQAPGELKLCLLVDRWQVVSNTSGGRITYSRRSNTVTFRDHLIVATPHPSPSPSPKPMVLPSTGSTSAPLAIGGACLVLLGAGAVLTARRRVLHSED